MRLALVHGVLYHRSTDTAHTHTHTQPGTHAKDKGPQQLLWSGIFSLHRCRQSSLGVCVSKITRKYEVRHRKYKKKEVPSRSRAQCSDSSHQRRSRDVALDFQQKRAASQITSHPSLPRHYFFIAKHHTTSQAKRAVTLTFHGVSILRCTSSVTIPRHSYGCPSPRGALSRSSVSPTLLLVFLVLRFFRDSQHNAHVM